MRRFQVGIFFPRFPTKFSLSEIWGYHHVHYIHVVWNITPCILVLGHQNFGRSSFLGPTIDDLRFNSYFAGRKVRLYYNYPAVILRFFILCILDRLLFYYTDNCPTSNTYNSKDTCRSSLDCSYVFCRVHFLI